MSADVLVPNATAALDMLEATLGVPPPKPSWRQRWDGFGFDAYWCRLDPDLTVAPTRLEIISPAAPPDPALDHPHMDAIFRAQGERPAKAHSTPISVPDIERLAERVASRGARFRLDPPIPELPIARLWVGVTGEDPANYLPDSDAGLRLEFLPTAGLMLPPGTALGRIPTGRRDDGSFTRVVGRLFVTDDASAACRTLAHYFDWEPDAIVGDASTGRRVRFGFGFARSGYIELMQPVGDSPEWSTLERWGPGPYGIRLAVNDLAAKADDLRRRGTRFELVERPDGEAVILVDPAHTTGTRFEIIEEATR